MTQLKTLLLAFAIVCCCADKTFGKAHVECFLADQPEICDVVFDKLEAQECAEKATGPSGSMLYAFFMGGVLLGGLCSLSIWGLLLKRR
jgi:hypothetical protein